MNTTESQARVHKLHRNNNTFAHSYSSHARNYRKTHTRSYYTFTCIGIRIRRYRRRDRPHPAFFRHCIALSLQPPQPQRRPPFHFVAARAGRQAGIRKKIKLKCCRFVAVVVVVDARIQRETRAGKRLAAESSVCTNEKYFEKEKRRATLLGFSLFPSLSLSPSTERNTKRSCPGKKVVVPSFLSLRERRRRRRLFRPFFRRSQLEA